MAMLFLFAYITLICFAYISQERDEQRLQDEDENFFYQSMHVTLIFKCIKLAGIV